LYCNSNQIYMSSEKDLIKVKVKLKILKTALKLIEKSGWEGMSVRKLSQKINYSTIKIYNEFGSKDGLLLELQKTSFIGFKEYVEKAVLKSNSSDEKLLNVSLAVWDFAFDKPHFFQLMFGTNGAPNLEKNDKRNQEIGYYLWKKLEESIPANRLDLMYNWWALIYGHILTDNFMFFEKRELRNMFSKSIERFYLSIK